MRKVIIFTLSVLVYAQVNAQEKVESEEKKELKNKQVELGLITTSITEPFNGSGIIFRIGNNRTLFRTTFSDISIDRRSNTFFSEITETNSFGSGISLGVEFRSLEHKKVVFRHGPQTSYSFSRSTSMSRDLVTNDLTERRSSSFNSFGLGYLLGFNCILSNHFQLGLDFIPSVSYVRRNSDTESFDQNIVDSNNNTEDITFRTGNIVFSLVYTWKK